MKRTIPFLVFMLIASCFFGQDRSQADFWNIPASHLSEVLALNNMNLEAETFVDNKQKLDSIVAYNSTGIAWVTNTFTYNDNEQLVLSIFTFLTTGEREKTEYTYDANGHLTSYIIYNWNSYLEMWQEAEKDEYTYNSSGKLILTIFYEWDDVTEQWVKDSRTEYTYDSEEKLIMMVESEWLNEWVEDWKSEYIFDINGNLIEQVDYDRWPSIWVKTWKHEYQYDGDNKLILEFDYEWESTGMLWLPMYRYEYTWDDQDNLMYDISYEWEASGSTWNNMDKSEYQYDTTYSYPEIIFPYTYDEFPWVFNHMITEQFYFSWSENTSSWELFYTTGFYYSDFIPGYIDEPDPIHFQLYPNPASDKIYIIVEDLSIDEVRVYSIAGKTVMQLSPQGDHIDISGLTPGLYIVELVVDGRKVREKLVVE